ncbi:MAG: S8 family serine peptidase [Chloroflexi bacterium]|nr:S8 family serine peptidase [Chloroflexota bacterium]
MRLPKLFALPLIGIALMLVLFQPWGGTASNQASTPANNVVYAQKIDAEVWKTLQGSPDGTVTVLALLAEQADLSAAAQIADHDTRGWAVYNTLHDTATRTQADVLAQLTSLQSEGHINRVKSYWIVNLILVQTNETGLWALAARPEISVILPEMKLELPTVLPGDIIQSPTAIEWGVTKIRAPEVWSTYGVTGAGAVAANVDTGVQYNHPALINQYRGNLGGGNFDHNYNWFDPTFATTAPTDGNGHGTHVMGTEIGDDGGTNQIGVAPDADWMAAFGCCPSNEALLDAQQFIVAPTDLAGNNPNPSLRPDVVNQSWGGPGGSQIFELVIASIRASGIFPAFSAGNNGSAAADGCGRLGSPGDNPSSFNVGSTDSNDNISSFSSRGPNPFTGATGPEVSAPGSSIRSSLPGSTYGSLSGTSMASPHVAGSVALLISLEPQLRGQVEQLEELLRKTAVPRTSSQTCGGVPGSEIPNNVFGWGRLDVKAAADMMYQAGVISGTVTSAGNPVVGGTVTFARLGYTLTTTTDSNGQYEVVAGAGTWNMTAFKYGYQTTTVNNVVVTQGNTTAQNFAISATVTHNYSGVIRDIVTEAGVAARVSVANQNVIPPVMANSDGSYAIVLPEGQHFLRIEHPGFDTIIQNILVTQTAIHDFNLTPRINYTLMDNQGGYPLYNWIEASGGTVYNLDDDASSAPINLPAPFTYFGTDYTSLRINSNGFIYFGTATYTTAHMVLPFEGRPNTDIMAFGEDLNPALGAQGTIYYLVSGSLVIIQFDEVQHWASGFPETFQIILNLVTDEITFQYQTVSWPDFATVGLENSDGSVGKMYSYANSANLVNGRAVRLTPMAGNAVTWETATQLTDLAFTMTDAPDPAEVGETITYTLTVNNAGPNSATGVTVVDTLPAAVTYQSATPSQGSCMQANGFVTCDLGSVANGAAATVTIVVTTTQTGTVNNTAGVYATSGDPNIINNGATTTTEVVPVTGPTTDVYLPFITKP